MRSDHQKGGEKYSQIRSVHDEIPFVAGTSDPD